MKGFVTIPSMQVGRKTIPVAGLYAVEPGSARLRRSITFALQTSHARKSGSWTKRLGLLKTRPSRPIPGFSSISLLPRDSKSASASSSPQSSSSKTSFYSKSSQAVLSMRFRKLSVALVSGFLASGAFYFHRTKIGLADSNSNSLSDQAYYSNMTGDNFKKALIISNNQLYSANLPSSEILAETNLDSNRKVLEMLTEERATIKLRKNQSSWLVNRGRGVNRYDSVQIPSNDPIEDDLAEAIINVGPSQDPAGDGDWMFWGVFDGHSGWTTSAKLRKSLVPYVTRELEQVYRSSKSPPGNEQINNAIKQGFVKLDQEIVHDSVKKVFAEKSKTMAAKLLAPALSGSCALLSFYDTRTKSLRVACTGDSRAVLGRLGPNGKWTATPLSIDQTGATPSEIERLRREHPNEPDVVSAGRVLGGLEPSRAFGDGSYKWTDDVRDRIKLHYFGRTRYRHLKSPPYVTAEPVVSTTKIQPEKGDFVVMATDGLWEMLSNEEVIGLVGKWINSQKKAAPVTEKDFQSKASMWLKGLVVDKEETQNDLPVHVSDNNAASKGQAGQRAAIRQQQWGTASTPWSDRFVVEDLNVATHLARNALGGKNTGQLTALLTLPSPFARWYRDDLTIQVIFFGPPAGLPTSGSVGPSSSQSSTKSTSESSDSHADSKLMTGPRQDSNLSYVTSAEKSSGVVLNRPAASECHDEIAERCAKSKL